MYVKQFDEKDLITIYVLEGSINGENFFMIEDKSDAMKDLSHDFLVMVQ